MKFIRKNFEYSGGYLTYRMDGDWTGKFVARFKYAKQDKPGFVSFLIKNFEVEEYFGRLQCDAPVRILESKGYVSKTVKDLLAKKGYPQTQEGFKNYIHLECA